MLSICTLNVFRQLLLSRHVIKTFDNTLNDVVYAKRRIATLLPLIYTEHLSSQGSLIEINCLLHISLQDRS
jgi:hypothetical protein